MTTAGPLETQTWPIDRLVLYARNPRKNDAVVDRMCRWAHVRADRSGGSKQPFFYTSELDVLRKSQLTATLGLIWWYGGKQGPW